MSDPNRFHEVDGTFPGSVLAARRALAAQDVAAPEAAPAAVAAVSLGRNAAVPSARRIAAWRFGPFRLSRVRVTGAQAAPIPFDGQRADPGDWTLAVRVGGEALPGPPEDGEGRLGHGPAAATDGDAARTLAAGDWLLLAFPESAWPKHCACPAGPLEGPGADLFRDHLLALARHLPTAGERDREAFAEATRAMIAACLAGAVAAPRRSRSDAHSALEARVDAVIRENLSSALLDTARICALAGVSRSALYRMFEGRGGVAAHVRALRLELVRADLADPALAGEPIARIAERRGLFCTTSFNRAFRRAFGCTPGDVRAAAMARNGEPVAADAETGDEAAVARPAPQLAS